ncbi:MAG: glycosyltransferase family 2 protein [Hyphomicrobium sp.]
MSAPDKVEVSIIVVSYNTRAMTLAALDSIVAETRGVCYEIIVVDNASSDGSAETIARHPSGPRLIALDQNIGFARANNLAADQARGRYILLLNSDTVVLDGAIDRLVAFARANRKALIWGGRTLFADGRLNPSSCWGRMTVWNLACRLVGLTALFPRSEWLNGECYGGWPRDRVREVDIVSGCFLLIPRSIWLALGGFDPLFFMYGDDADLCLRAERLGARPMITPEATIIHHGGASETALTGKMIKLLAAKASIIERHWRQPWQALGHHLLALWPASRWLATSLTAILTGSESARASASTWGDIWRARDEWRHGYGHTAAPAGRNTAPAPLLAELGSAT